MKVGAFVKHAEHVASYRYRVQIPAAHCDALEYVDGWTRPDIDVGLFGKHLGCGLLADQGPVYEAIATCRARGVPIVADLCDDHFGEVLGEHYRRVIDEADAVVVATEMLADTVRRECGREASVIEDPHEFDECAPTYGGGARLLWYGHATNYGALERVRPDLGGFEVRAIGNHAACEPYSAQALREALAWCDLVIVPTFKTRKFQSKGANRAVEAIRAGRFVVAHDMPAYRGLDIWLGDIREGIEWAQCNQSQVQQRITSAQQIVRSRFSPKLAARKWASVFCSTWDVATRSIRVGSTSTQAQGGLTSNRM